jgi:hypothetical protein
MKSELGGMREKKSSEFFSQYFAKAFVKHSLGIKFPLCGI